MFVALLKMMQAVLWNTDEWRVIMQIFVMYIEKDMSIYMTVFNAAFVILGNQLRIHIAAWWCNRSIWSRANQCNRIHLSQYTCGQWFFGLWKSKSEKIHNTCEYIYPFFMQTEWTFI
jgi:hypothetical protein